MLVIKLGGSLLATGKLRQCLQVIASRYQGRAVVIVPGGGAFAGQVRHAQQAWQFDDVTAHRMAILAMQQMALLINGLQPNLEIINNVNELGKPCAAQVISLWSADISELDLADIPNSWNISSDSLSAWLADQLKADELIVVKSAAIANNETIQELTKRGVVDAGFEHYIKQLTSCKLTVLNAEKFLS